MLNKKAIAAFAAGATLLAGFAMSAPAFAAECTPATAAELLAAQTTIDSDLEAVNTAKKTLRKAEQDLSKEKIELKKRDRALAEAKSKNKKAKDAFDKADGALKAAQEAYAQKKEKDDKNTKTHKALLAEYLTDTDAAVVKERTPLVNAKKAAQKVYFGENGSEDAPEANTTLQKLNAAQADYNTQNDTVKSKAAEVEDDKTALNDRNAELQDDRDNLAELECKKPKTPKTPKTPAKPGKPGKPGKPNKGGVHINTKGHKGKKQLSKTGVGVAFAALAAAMLAGMGAAVRKIRH